MVYSFKVFKKCAPNGKLTLYMPKRDFVDHISFVEPIEGVVVVDEAYAGARGVWAQVVCTFRYGREQDEVMGLTFYKELFLASQRVFPPPEKAPEPSKIQERLLKKLGPSAFAFSLAVPAGAPGSVALQPALEDEGEPCGVSYYVKVFVGDSEIDRSHRRSTVALGVRKLQFAPAARAGPPPSTTVRKDFVLSPGELELTLSLPRHVFLQGEPVPVRVSVRNNSTKQVVKRIKASVVQSVDVVLLQGGQYRRTVASAETTDGCPLQPGAALVRELPLTPALAACRDQAGVALDAARPRDATLASTTLLLEPEQRDAFGILVSYSAKVKLYLGALSGELVAELPFLLMHPKEGRGKLVSAESVGVETFRQDTVTHQESLEVY